MARCGTSWACYLEDRLRGPERPKMGGVRPIFPTRIPAFRNDYINDLRMKRFYVGRPEGPIKTFPPPGIKDSPPYLYDGRRPTPHDALEFFNIILEVKLTTGEKEDWMAFLLCS